MKRVKIRSFSGCCCFACGSANGGISIRYRAAAFLKNYFMLFSIVYCVRTVIVRCLLVICTSREGTDEKMTTKGNKRKV